MEKQKKEQRKCTTPKFRASFPHVFQPHSGFEGQEAKYSVVMLFDKKTDLSVLKKAALAAANDKWGDKTKWPKSLRMPFRDGNEKSDLQGYEDTIFISASSKKRPGLVDQSLQPIAETDESFYAGCYARATLVAFAYDTAGNKGVSFALQNLQKVGDGEAFSGRKRAEDDFDLVEDSSGSPESYGQDDDADLGI